MAPPTPEELETLRRLAQSREGRLLVRVFQARLVALDKANRKAIGENLIRSQGRAVELEEILSEVLGVGEAQAPQLASRGKQPTSTRPAIERYRVNHMAD